MSLLELGTKAQVALLAAAPPDPSPGDLPPKINAAANTIVGMMISVAGILAVVALVAAFVLLMMGEESRGSGGGKIMKVLAGLAGALGAGWIVGTIWAA